MSTMHYRMNDDKIFVFYYIDNVPVAKEAIT